MFNQGGKVKINSKLKVKVEQKNPREQGQWPYQQGSQQKKTREGEKKAQVEVGKITKIVQIKKAQRKDYAKNET